MFEKKNPHLKKLLIVFLAAFLILVGLAGLKLYLDVSKISDVVEQSAERNQSERPTAEDIKQQLEMLNEGGDMDKRPNVGDIEKQLDTLNTKEDIEKRPTEEEVRRQLDALSQE